MRQAYTTTCSNVIFKGRSKRSCTRRKKIPYASLASDIFFSGTACHTVCGSQQYFMAVPVSLLSALVSPRQVVLHPAWHGFICTAWRSAAAYIHAQPYAVHAPCGEKLPAPLATSRHKYTRCPRMCSPAKPPAALRILLHTPSLICNANAKSYTVRPGICILSRLPHPVALAANLLIAFRQFALGRAASPWPQGVAVRGGTAAGAFTHGCSQAVRKFRVVYYKISNFM